MKYFQITIMIILALIISFILIKKGKKIRIKGINTGPFVAEIVEKKIEKIKLMSVPLASCVGEILTPYLKILLVDSADRPIEFKKVRLEIFDERGLVSSKNYSGCITGTSNKKGIIVFNDLVLLKTGQVRIHIIVDNLLEVTDDIDIFPPGLNIDFWNETVGSDEYIEKWERAYRFSKKCKE